MFRLCAMLVLGVVVVTAPSGSVAQQTRPSSGKVVGNYPVVVFAGYFTGRGNANVSPKVVVINGQVADDGGDSGHFHAKCTRNGNLFSGTASAPGGASITVKGRLDPANKSLPRSRLSFTYIVSTGKAGRAAGDHR